VGYDTGDEVEMHISEGILSAPVLIGGAAASLCGVALGLKKMDYSVIPEVAVVSSAFFVASLIHVPVGPSSVHLVLNGLVGVLLGWMAFPSIVVALCLQALLFQFGGFTVLGVNTFNMAFPAVCSFYVFRILMKVLGDRAYGLAGFIAGVTGILGGVVLIAVCMVTTGEQFINVAKLIFLSHLPVMVIEGIITLFCVVFLKKVKPEILRIWR
jgi:cobalt/nickel transport system permease protein